MYLGEVWKIMKIGDRAERPGGRVRIKKTSESEFYVLTVASYNPLLRTPNIMADDWERTKERRETSVVVLGDEVGPGGAVYYRIQTKDPIPVGKPCDAKLVWEE